MIATRPRSVFIKVVGTGQQGCDLSSVIALRLLDTQLNQTSDRAIQFRNVCVQLVALCFLQAALEAYISFPPRQVNPFSC